MTTSPDMRIRFLIRLGTTLHAFGVPAHRLEDALVNAADRLGIEAQFFSGPTSLISSFGPAGEQHTALNRVQPGLVQLDKLVELDAVVEALYRGEINVTVAEGRLREITAAGERFGPVATVTAFAVASGTAARFFGGGALEMGLGAILGLIIGLLALAAIRFVSVNRVFEFLASMVVTVLALGVTSMWRPLAASEVILASLILLLPGLTLTLALNELASQHLVSGTARFMGAMVTFMKLGLGVGIGTRVASFLPGEVIDAAPVPLPGWTLWVSLLITPFALTVLFRARWRESLWILAATVAAFWGASEGVGLLGPGIGAVVGAFLAGLVANLFARWQRKPAVVLIVPSIILLVPGSIGYRGVNLFMANDVMSGVGEIFTGLLVGVSLVAGLLLANVMLPPRNAL